jgi:hypothetical protein
MNKSGTAKDFIFRLLGISFPERGRFFLCLEIIFSHGQLEVSVLKNLNHERYERWKDRKNQQRK